MTGLARLASPRSSSALASSTPSRGFGSRGGRYRLTGRVAQLRQQPEAAALGRQLETLGLRIIEVAEEPRMRRAREHARGLALLFRQRCSSMRSTHSVHFFMRARRLRPARARRKGTPRRTGCIPCTCPDRPARCRRRACRRRPWDIRVTQAASSQCRQDIGKLIVLLRGILPDLVVADAVEPDAGWLRPDRDRSRTGAR